MGSNPAQGIKSFSSNENVIQRVVRLWSLLNSLSLYIYIHHHDFIQSCQRNNVFPDGLQLRKTANIGIVSPDFEEKWSKFLRTRRVD